MDTTRSAVRATVRRSASKPDERRGCLRIRAEQGLADAHQTYRSLMTWHHEAAIIGYVLVAFLIGFWLGAKSKTWDWNDGHREGYRKGLQDGEARGSSDRP